MYFEDIENPTEAQKQANEELAQILDQARKLMRRAAEIGKEHNLTFHQGFDGYGRFDPDDYGWQSSDVCY